MSDKNSSNESQEIIKVIEMLEVISPLPCYKQLPDEKLIKILQHKKLIIKMLDEIETRIENRLKSGENIIGASLVPKRGIRKYNSPETAANDLKELVDDESELFDVKLKSPTQMMKVNEKVKDYVMANSSHVSSGDKIQLVNSLESFSNDFSNLLTDLKEKS